MNKSNVTLKPLTSLPIDKETLIKKSLDDLIVSYRDYLIYIDQQ